MSTPLLRLAYATQYLIALITVYVLWAQVGGQSHLDAMPWFIKLGFGAGAALAIVKATAEAVGHERAWNGGTLRWLGVLLLLLVGCGLASYYSHLYLEPDDEQDQPDTPSAVGAVRLTPIDRFGTSVANYAGTIRLDSPGFGGLTSRTDI